MARPDQFDFFRGHQYLLLKEERFFFLRPESAGLTLMLRPATNFPFKALIA
jgi:hypothetical protein